MRSERVVVIGGDAGGMSAASQARRLRPDLSIVAFERGSFTSYSACGMPYLVSGQVASADDLVARTPEEFRSQGIDARVHHQVEEIDLAARRVRVTQLDGGVSLSEPFDQLVIATGTRVRPLAGAAPEPSHVYRLSTLDDGRSLRAAVDQLRPRRVVLVGGGYINLELAEAMVLRGIPVALIHAGPEVLSLLDADIGALVSRAVRQAGVELYLGERAVGFEAHADGSVAAVVTSARTLRADLVVVGAGVFPRTELAQAAGIPLGASGAIVVDDHQRTPVDGVWAAGDCAEAYHRVRRQPVRVALGTVANKQGRICGLNLGGQDARFPGVVGTAITKLLDLEVARTGVTEREARELGLAHVAGTIRSTSRAGYYPDAGSMVVKVVAERGTGRLLGAQIVGTQGAGLRIDAVAVALHAEMAVDAFMYLDLAYAPPFSSVWDPLLIAARKAAEQL